jgi:hypothetical protein
VKDGLFERGDTVRLHSGTSPQKVMDVKQVSGSVARRAGVHDGTQVLLTCYLSGLAGWNGAYPYERRWRAASDYVLLPPKPAQATQENVMPKLYQVTYDGKPALLVKNSAGDLVLELKGSGDVAAFKPSEAEEVRPYTVSVKFVDSGTIYHFEAVKGSVEVGDRLLLDSDAVARVIALDTKSPSATKKLRGRKLLTAPLPQVGDGTDDTDGDD